MNRCIPSYHRWSSLYITVMLFITVVLLPPSCATNANKTQHDSNNAQYLVITPFLLDTVLTQEYVADIQAIENVGLRARVKGFIEKVHIDEGKPVQAGQLLFTLSSREFKEDLLKANAQLKSARAELKAAEVEIKNTQLLANEDIVAGTALESARAKKEILEAKIDEAASAIAIARLNLSFTQVKAPFSGIINRLPNKTGSLVDDGTLLTTLSNSREVYAYFHVSEKEYLDIARQQQLGTPQEVSLVLADGLTLPLKGLVETIESEINQGTGSIAFRARFKNPDHLLRHGASATVLMHTRLKNALAIPQKSTFEVQDKLFVYVVDSTNTVQRKSLVIRHRLPHLYIVASGINPEDRIIYEGIQLVREGEKISPQWAPRNEVTARLTRQ